jgi:hypothetical protein
MPEQQATIDSILAGRAIGPGFRRARERFLEALPRGPGSLFSAFVDQHLRRALELAYRFEQVTVESGLDAALRAIQEALIDEPVVGLVQYAVLLFLTHNPEARSKIKIKPLEIRQPDLVLSSAAAPPGVTTLSGAVPPAGGPTPQDGLSYWREDPLINEHHEHWHLVYPTDLSPLPTPGAAGYPIGDRHGELFFYMHQQMIARYDAERVGLGLKRVSPFATSTYTERQFRAAIPEGYNPGPLKLWDGEKPYLFRARPAGASLSDLTLDESSSGGPNWPKIRPGAKLAQEANFASLLMDAATSGFYRLVGGKAVTVDNLGNTAEANINAVDFVDTNPPANHPLYGNCHNDGHIHFMLYDNIAPYGVMAATTTAIRDPIFFRWHKLIDDICFSHQETQPAYDFSTGPNVTIRKHESGGITDIILCLGQDLPASIAGHKFGSRTYNDLAAAAFAGGEWNKDFSRGVVYLKSGEAIATTDELLTEMLSRKIALEQEDGKRVEETIEYLSHDDFYYFLRLQNNEDQDQTVAVRIFMAPESETADRRAWIEMDRFAARIAAHGRVVVFRPADQSSVIRKPALRPEDLAAEDGATRAREAQAWCDCGWPYTVLLPRGTREGMDFRLLVMCSSGEDLIMPDHPECCTSISYCGLQSLEYPDKTAMGYPFDRPFRATIPDTARLFDNWASRKIRIRCRNI